MSFKKFIKELNGSRTEGELIKTMLYSLLASFIFLAILYVFKFRYIDNFIPKYSLSLFFSALSYAILMPAIKQVNAYKEMPCMSGMMIGMTSGMIAGFLPGFYIASTNGMFIGSVFGMALGILFGIYNGKCCGIMGIMEGIMAGFMGGLMGAMTSFMLLNDNLKAISVIVFIISAFIMFGLNYMIYRETREINPEIKKDVLSILMVSLILITITTWLIVFSPRNPLFT